EAATVAAAGVAARAAALTIVLQDELVPAVTAVTVAKGETAVMVGRADTVAQAAPPGCSANSVVPATAEWVEPGASAPAVEAVYPDKAVLTAAADMAQRAKWEPLAKTAPLGNPDNPADRASTREHGGVKCRTDLHSLTAYYAQPKPRQRRRLRVK
ncbi:hypothetical protein, partial [Mycobacterium persicum]|uniref:hypothetical protein n=1 Tax=Mycobacterium persicum TaxID=1487726 RepID=UPI001C61326F